MTKMFLRFIHEFAIGMGGCGATSAGGASNRCHCLACPDPEFMGAYQQGARSEDGDAPGGRGI